MGKRLQISLHKLLVSHREEDVNTAPNEEMEELGTGRGRAEGGWGQAQTLLLASRTWLFPSAGGVVISLEIYAPQGADLAGVGPQAGPSVRPWFPHCHHPPKRTYKGHCWAVRSLYVTTLSFCNVTIRLTENVLALRRHVTFRWEGW